MFNSLILLKAFLWLISVFHLLTGISLNFPIGLKEQIGSKLYGADIDWSERQFGYILKPLGAFMFALGIMAAIAAQNPLRNRAIVYGFATLFSLRGLQRVVYKQEIYESFAVAPESQAKAVAFMFFSAASLMGLYHHAESQESATNPAARQR